MDNFPPPQKAKGSSKLHPTTVIVQTTSKNPPLKEIVIIPPLPHTIIPDRSLGSSNQSSSNRAASRLLEVPTQRRTKKDLEDEQIYSETSSEGEVIGNRKLYTCAKYEEGSVTPEILQSTERKDAKPKVQPGLFLDLQQITNKLSRQVTQKRVSLMSKYPLKITPKLAGNPNEKPAELMEDILEKVKAVKSRNQSMKKRLEQLHTFTKTPLSTAKPTSTKHTIVGSFHTGIQHATGSSPSATPSALGSSNSVLQLKSRIHWVNKIHHRGSERASLCPVNEGLLLSIKRASVHSFHVNDVYVFNLLDVPLHITTTSGGGTAAAQDSKLGSDKRKCEVLLAAGHGLIKNYCGKVLYSGYVEFGKIHGKGTLYNTAIENGDTDHLCSFVEQINPGLKDVHFLKRAKSFRSIWVKYVGDWRNNKIHGWGTLQYLSGATYEGNFHNGWITGVGTFTSGKLVVTGSWKENELMQVLPTKPDRIDIPEFIPELPSRALSARPATQMFAEMREPQTRVEDLTGKFRKDSKRPATFTKDDYDTDQLNIEGFLMPHTIQFTHPKTSTRNLEWAELEDDFKDFGSLEDF